MADIDQIALSAIAYLKDIVRPVEVVERVIIIIMFNDCLLFVLVIISKGRNEIVVHMAERGTPHNEDIKVSPFDKIFLAALAVDSGCPL